jgi:hypothetical protein
MIERSNRSGRDQAMTTTGTTPKAGPKFQGQAVDGYSVVKSTPAFDQLAKTGTTDETAPRWLTRCNAHGATAPAASRKAGRALGAAAQRATWCSGCKVGAAKAG